MAGFGLPAALLAGFILVSGLELYSNNWNDYWSNILYIIGNYFFKDIIKEKFLIKFKNLETKFKNQNLFIFSLQIYWRHPFCTIKCATLYF